MHAIDHGMADRPKVGRSGGEQTMTKLMTLIKSAPAVSPQRFAEHWRERFLPTFLELESPKRHLSKAVHHNGLPTKIREDEGLGRGQWAGVGCYYFDSQSAAEALLADPAFKALLEDNTEMIAQATHLLVDEVWIYDRDPSYLPLKMFAFFKRKPEWSRAAARQ